jgi:uncharacterized protein (TIGR02265 family)
MAMSRDEGASIDEREVSGSMTGVLLRHLRAAHGDEMVAHVLAQAGETRSVGELESIETWSRYQQVADLYLAAVELTGDQNVGRLCGERLMQEYSGTGVDAVLRSLGSPGEVLRNVAQAAAKFSTVIRMEAIDVGETHAVISARNRPGFPLLKVVCEYTQGVVAQAAPLFGMDTAHVVERQCQAEGAESCIYHVAWDPASARDNLQRRIDHLEGELGDLTRRFEALTSTASNLVSASDVEALLAVIVDRAADTVRAPQHLLAVRFRETGAVHVHHRGFGDGDTAVAVDEILAASPDDRGGSRLIVDVASHSRRYGRLAALYPEGACFLPTERRLLQAYAGHAAAALEAAAARQEAENRNATARALLALAASLAQVGTQREVATRLADAVPRVVDCDGACVLLWDNVAQQLQLEAAVGIGAETEARLRATPLSETEVPGLDAMIRSRQPVFLHDSEMSLALRNVLGSRETASMAVVPITNRTEFFGVVTTFVRVDAHRLRDDEHLIERLRGMADHAATALLNARLLERIRHQALHDGLTGLPNRLLFQDRAEHAAARARRGQCSVALIFVDLNGFKAVNDELGHAAGDKLLAEVARRLEGLVRESDTVGRLGGDEFAMLLTDAAHTRAIETFAQRITAEINRPYVIDQQHVTVSASLGISIMEATDDYETLLHRADVAMYRAKREQAA